MKAIQKLIESAEFGTKFKTRDGSPALFCRTCDNSEWKMADFYVKDWGMVRVNRENGCALTREDPEDREARTYTYNDIVGLWDA